MVGTGTATSAHYHSGQLLQTPCATKHGSEQISLRIPRFCIAQIEQQFRRMLFNVIISSVSLEGVFNNQAINEILEPRLIRQ